jgi:hypothetical protein
MSGVRPEHADTAVQPCSGELMALHLVCLIPTAEIQHCLNPRLGLWTASLQYVDGTGGCCSLGYGNIQPIANVKSGRNEQTYSDSCIDALGKLEHTKVPGSVLNSRNVAMKRAKCRSPA